MKIIAIGHEKQVGKDTAARFLINILKTESALYKNIVRVGFASKIKSVSWDLFKQYGLKDEQYYEDNPKEKDKILPLIGKTPRDIWIHTGNTLRLVHDEVWIDYPLCVINCDVLVFSDLRFWTEFKKVKKKGGLCIKITNNRVKHTSDAADDVLLDCKEWDYIIENNEGLHELHDKIYLFAKEFKLI